MLTLPGDVTQGYLYDCLSTGIEPPAGKVRPTTTPPPPPPPPPPPTTTTLLPPPPQSTTTTLLPSPPYSLTSTPSSHNFGTTR